MNVNDQEAGVGVDAAHANADTLMLALMGVGLLAAIGIGSQYGRAGEALWAGLPILAATALAWGIARGTFLGRASMAVFSMAMVSLQIHVGYGDNLYHFGVFVTLAILLVYRDWRVLVIAAALIAVQHAVFNLLQQAGIGVSCFSKPSWAEVVAHATYVIIQTGAEVWIALRLARDEKTALEVQRLVVARDGSIDLDVRNAAVSTTLGTSVAEALSLMRDSVHRVIESASQVRTGSTGIARGNADLARRTDAQAAGLEEASAAIERFADALKQNTDDAGRANELAVGASEVAARGGTVVREVVTTMNSISESSKRIADIIGIIDGIAFQTNILALNAAVEAARAGEQGRGFAVVASEVRSLAQRSAAAAQETKQLILSSSERVEAGTRLADNAGRTMDEMVAAVREVAGLIANIARVSGQQRSSIDEVARSIDSIERDTRQNAAQVQHSSDAARELERQAEMLAAAVSRFRLGHQSASETPALAPSSSRQLAVRDVVPG